MGVKIGVTVMSALLLLYIFAVGQLAIRLLSSGDWVAVSIGVALAVLPILGVWGLVVEVRFGVRSERLLARLEAEGLAPNEPVPVLPSGRPARDSADSAFPRFREAVEADPSSWRSWLRLAIAYDAAGDRRRARHAVRRAIALDRAET